MRQVLYNSAAYRLRFEYPPDWSASTVTSVKLTVTDTSATELLAATTCTQFTANTINGATSAGASSLILTTAVSYSPVEGDLFTIAASASGPSETVECLYYASATKTMTLKQDMRYAHATGTAIYGRFCYHDMVTTSTSTFTKALQMILSWQAYASTALAYPAVTERAEITSLTYGGNDMAGRFALLYPRENRVITANDALFTDYFAEAKKQLSIELRGRGLMMDRVVDQERLDPSLLTLTRYLVTLGGGDDWETERNVALNEYARQFEILCSEPIWTDENLDGAQDDDEIDDHSKEQLLNSERAI